MKKSLLKGFILLSVFLLCFQGNAQSFNYINDKRDTLITLHPDTTDFYVLSYYITGRYRVEIGYNAYFKELEEMAKYDQSKQTARVIKHYVDSVKKRKKIVPLFSPHEILFKDSAGGMDFELDSYAGEIIADLFEEGNIKVYDFRKKYYIQKVFISRKNANDEVYDEYSDPITGKVFFTNIISSPVY